MLVRRVRRLSSAEIETAVGTLRSEFGAVRAFTDGLLVVGDRVEVLQRMCELLDRVEAVETPTWVVQVYLVSLTEKDAIDLGMNVTPGAQLAATLAAASTGLNGQPGATAAMSATLGAVLRAAESHETVGIVADPCLLILDGTKATFSRGQRLPVAQSVIAGQTGVVSTAGYQYLQTGLTLLMDLREQSATSVLIDIDLTLSTLAGYSDGAPILSTEHMACAAIYHSGGAYYVGSLRRLDTDHVHSNWNHVGETRTDNDENLTVWLRTFRIGGNGSTLPGAKAAAVAEERPSDGAEAVAAVMELLPPVDPRAATPAASSTGR